MPHGWSSVSSPNSPTPPYLSSSQLSTDILVLPLRLLVGFRVGGRLPGVLVTDGYELELVDTELGPTAGGTRCVVGDVGDRCRRPGEDDQFADVGIRGDSEYVCGGGPLSVLVGRLIGEVTLYGYWFGGADPGSGPLPYCIPIPDGAEDD